MEWKRGDLVLEVGYVVDTIIKQERALDRLVSGMMVIRKANLVQ